MVSCYFLVAGATSDSLIKKRNGREASSLKQPDMPTPSLPVNWTLRELAKEFILILNPSFPDFSSQNALPNYLAECMNHRDHCQSSSFQLCKKIIVIRKICWFLRKIQKVTDFGSLQGFG
jgi:hypothetical protein